MQADVLNGSKARLGEAADGVGGSMAATGLYVPALS